MNMDSSPLNFDPEIIQKVLSEIAPELGELWIQRKDDFEEEGIRTGRLHENHILGIILSCDSLNKKQITTQNIESLYQQYFKKIARSTVSTYLNQLDKEGVLSKERKGRIVYYYLKQQPPEGINPFWIVRNFCILPAYFARAQYIARFYFQETSLSEENLKGRKFIIGLILLTLFKNRFSKCMLCQFAARQGYRDLKEEFDIVLRDRRDVLPDTLRDFIEKQMGEIPVFGGLKIPEEVSDEEINKKIDDLVVRHAQDIDFQMGVSQRRQEIRLSQKKKPKYLPH